jgi:hypothetical protein
MSLESEFAAASKKIHSLVNQELAPKFNCQSSANRTLADNKTMRGGVGNVRDNLGAQEGKANRPYSRDFMESDAVDAFHPSCLHALAVLQSIRLMRQSGSVPGITG